MVLAPGIAAQFRLREVCRSAWAVAELDRSDMPDVYKIAKRRTLRLKMDPFRPPLKRLALSAVYDADDTVVADPSDASSLIVAEWQPVLEERSVEADAMQQFLDMAPARASAANWSWPRNRVSDVADAMPPSAPGPGGLRYSFLARAGPVATVSRRRRGGGDSFGPAAAYHFSTPHSVEPERGIYRRHGQTQVRRKVISLRPITLMQTSAKLLATVANEELSDVASRVVAGDQHGFTKGRNMEDNVIAFEGSTYAYSHLR